MKDKTEKKMKIYFKMQSRPPPPLRPAQSVEGLLCPGHFSIFFCFCFIGVFLFVCLFRCFWGNKNGSF